MAQALAPSSGVPNHAIGEAGVARLHHPSGKDHVPGTEATPQGSANKQHLHARRALRGAGDHDRGRRTQIVRRAALVHPAIFADQGPQR